ncbi:MAG: hypothetical protein M3Z24_06750, partial [Chloroflexota bacterium]|nr:hypothetical protein [Chloroflexota bacterium]
EDRYPTCHAMAEALKQALPGASGNTSSRLFTPRGLFDPAWQTGSVKAMSTTLPAAKPTAPKLSVANPDMGNATNSFPAAPNRSNGLLSRTGMFPTMSGKTGQLPAASPTNKLPTTPLEAQSPGRSQFSLKQPTTRALPTATQTLPSPTGTLTSTEIGKKTGQLPVPQGTEPINNTNLIVPNNAQITHQLKNMTGAVKVVQVPIAGQPGKYVTGFLPANTTNTQNTETTLPTSKPKDRKKLFVTNAIILFVLLIIGVPSLYWYTQIYSVSHTHNKAGSTATVSSTPDLKATANAQATAKASENIVLVDSLATNIHNWPTNKNEFFANGAYHILNTTDSGIAVPLALKPFNFPFVYTLTMEEIQGNDSINSNTFGMILNLNTVTKGGQTSESFYTFEVVNNPGGSYRFSHYDGSNPSSPWTPIWNQAFGPEFHQGQGPKSINTFKVAENGNSFTFTINGKVLGTVPVKNGLTSGNIGMFVNLKGTEVAFSNMLITYK